jgi:MoaA/NifB/PqqE/SkfB family radical SAM enzyme
MHNNSNILKPIDINKLSKNIDYLQKGWYFILSGGEPFLEKNFVELCLKITKKHYIGIITNLSNPNVYDFADNIVPDKCLSINASVHITQREKTDVKMKSFIEKMLYLQEKGFNATAVYVGHPTLIDRIESDFAFLKSSGILKVKLKTFYGDYNGKHYPSSFELKQKEFFSRFETDYPEYEILHQTPINYHGRLCHTGQRFFIMDRDGNLRRCYSTVKDYGNLFDKSFRFDAKPKTCPQTQYACPHECIMNSIPKRGNNFSIMIEDYIEKMLRSKPHEYTNNKFWIISGAMFDKMGIIFNPVKIKEITSRKYLFHKFWLMIAALEKAGIPFSKVKKIFVRR